MGTKTKTERLRQPRVAIPQFVSKTDMADTLRCSVDVVTEWVEKGHFPRPWLYPGPERRISLWRADHFAAYADSGEWPKEAWRKGQGED